MIVNRAGPRAPGPSVSVVGSVAKVVKSEPTKPGPSSPDAGAMPNARGGFSVRATVCVTPPEVAEMVATVGWVTAEA